MMDINYFEELSAKQQGAVAKAYGAPDRTITSQDIAGSTGRALVRLGVFVSQQPARGAYYMPYTLTPDGAELYERSGRI